MSRYNFGGGHLGFKDGRHAKIFSPIAPPTGQDRHINGCTYIFGVEKKDGSIHKLFSGDRFEIQDGRHIGSNLVTISPASRDRKIITYKVCVYVYCVCAMCPSCKM